MTETGAGAYEAAGVDYAVLDAAKRRSIEAVRSSLAWPEQAGAHVLPETVGEPAQVVEVGGLRLATVIECLGTKSTVALEAEPLGIDGWPAIGVDTVAAVLNDLCCAGAVPLTFSAYVATGDPAWYSGSRHASLLEGIRRACAECRAAFVGGESPTLSGVVAAGGVDLAGAAVGLVEKEVWGGRRLEPGDDIVLVASSGLHANGASLARRVASSLRAGWATELPSGRALGEALLDASALYPPLVLALSRSGLPVHYASHVTGHGLRKLMRAERELTYRIRELPPVPEVLAWLASAAGLDDATAYGTFNMGAGFALYLPEGAGEPAAALAESAGYRAVVAGRVEEGPRQVVLEPIGVVYGAESLELR
jgi:phosphoribosylformylglycinamidine cyclo-ligase